MVYTYVYKGNDDVFILIRFESKDLCMNLGYFIKVCKFMDQHQVLSPFTRCLICYQDGLSVFF